MADFGVLVGDDPFTRWDLRRDGQAVCGESSCLKPWAILDKWIDHHDDPNDAVWIADDTFETVDGQGNPLNDVYADISTNPSSTGFQLPRDLGLLVTLKIADPQDGMKSGYFYAINLGTAGEGASAYRSAIATCQDPAPPHFGDILQPLTGNPVSPRIVIGALHTTVWAQRSRPASVSYCRRVALSEEVDHDDPRVW